MKITVLPPGPQPKSLSANAVIRDLAEHKKAFLNKHNKKGFIEDDISDYVAVYEKRLENNKKVSLNQLLRLRGMKLHSHQAPTRIGTLRYEYKGNNE